MPTRRWDPFQDLIAIHQAMFGEGSEPGLGEGGRGGWTPPVDVYETTEAYVIKAEVPGVDSEKIKLAYRDKQLVLTGERPAPKQGQVKHHQAERLYGPFTRTFSLPDCVDCALIDANLEDGVLEVVVPKQPQPAAKSINVKFE